MKYSTYIEQSDDHRIKAQQQLFDITKFSFASATYNSVELVQDQYLLEEFHYFCQFLNSDIVHMYLFVSFTEIFIKIYSGSDYYLFDIYWFRTSTDDAFQWLHKKIDEKSSACNSMYYIVHLYVAKSIKSRSLIQHDSDRNM